MSTIIEGHLNANGLQIGIVAARFNSFITEQLLNGALDALKRHDGNLEHLDIAWVPGAFEIALTAKKMASAKRYDAIVCLGAVIRGSTPHFDFVAAEAAKGIGGLSLECMTPIIFGVLTTHTIEQAIERSGTKAGNKGFEAMVSAIETANLHKKLAEL